MQSRAHLPWIAFRSGETGELRHSNENENLVARAVIPTLAFILRSEASSDAGVDLENAVRQDGAASKDAHSS
jgi:hypothetical protein